MIKVNNNEYKLLLLDTNALSDLLKNKKEWIEYIDREFTISKSVICYSVFSLSELSKNDVIFDEYLKFFSVYPSVILDGYEAIFNKELSVYGNSGEEVNPITITPYAIFDDSIKSPEVRLRKVLEMSGFYNRTDYWVNSRESVLENILNLKENYRPKGNKFTKKEIEEFVYLATIQQVMFRNLKFAEKIVKINKSEIDINQFPSVVATSYVVFYKFYPDKRKSEPSDIFDIMISSLLPYVDYFISEGHLCEIIKKVQNIHGFLSDLTFYSIRKIKKEIKNNHRTIACT